MLKTKRATNIQQVAKLAGCSQVTVARVFAEKVKVSEKTRIKVLKAAQELGYKPNILARGLRGGNTDSVALLFFQQMAYDSPSVHSIIADLLWENEAKTSFTGMMRRDIVNSILLDYLRRKVDGIIIEWALTEEYPFLPEHEKLLAEFPAAVMVSAKKQNADIDQVIWDRGEAVKDAVKHLVNSGRKKLGLLIPKSNKTKCEGFDEQMIQFGLDPKPGHIMRHGEKMLSSEDAYKFLDKHFPDGRLPYDSLLCSNDKIAVAAINWLQTHGYRVPGDVAVVGYDNCQFGEFISPALASAERRHHDVAEKAYEFLSTRMKEPDLPSRTEYIPMKFVWRESAGGKR